MFCNRANYTRCTFQCILSHKSHCSTVHFRRITSIYQSTNAHIISHKTLLKHFKTLRHVSILSDHQQGALFLAKVILQYSQFNSYLQTRCCSSIICVVEQWLGVCRIRRTPSHCSTTHSHTTWYAATTPRLRIRIELWILWYNFSKEQSSLMVIWQDRNISECFKVF